MVPVTEFLMAVEDHVDVVVRHRGDARSGVDCVGLIVSALRECGTVVEHGITYGTWPDSEKLTAGLRQFCAETDKIAPGVIAQTYAGQAPRHLSVVVGFDGTGQVLVVHAWGKHKRVMKGILTDKVAKLWTINSIDYGI